jgi:hypothetical protein
MPGFPCFDTNLAPSITALRYFAPDGTDPRQPPGQASMIRRYIVWRNNHAYDEGVAASSTGQTYVA